MTVDNIKLESVAGPLLMFLQSTEMKRIYFRNFMIEETSTWLN